MYQHWAAFWLAVSFLSRLPAPAIIHYRPSQQQLANAYFGIVGAILGGISALVWLLSSALFNPALAAVITVITSVLLTGALHEDGLADTFDGLFGGKTLEDKRRIMKSSTLGTYGSIALWTSLTLRTLALIVCEHTVILLVISASLSRSAAVIVGMMLPYRGISGQSKSHGIVSTLAPSGYLILATSILIALFFSPAGFWLTLATCFGIMLGCYAWFLRNLGGYTGDCLGACQQLTEISLYLVIIGFAQ